MTKYTFTNLLENYRAPQLLNRFIIMTEEERLECIKRGVDFNEDSYVWLVGSSVLARLKNVAHMYGNLWDGEKHAFLGIHVLFLPRRPNEVILRKKENFKETPKTLVGDISTGYSYVDTDQAMAINELKMELNKQYGIAAMPQFEKEEKRMNTPLDKKTLAYAAQDVINTYNAYQAHKKALNRKLEDPIKKVIFNDPATIVYWKDGTKTIVMAQDEPFDPEKGLAMAMSKRALGNRGDYYNTFRKWLPEEKKESEEPEISLVELLTSKQLAKKLNTSISTVLRDCRRGLHPGAMKIKGKWLIPYSGLVGGSKNDN